jgi:hypothetical protein
MTPRHVSPNIHCHEGHLGNDVKLFTQMTDRGKSLSKFFSIIPLLDPEMFKVLFHHKSLGIHLQRERKDRKFTHSTKFSGEGPLPFAITLKLC